MSRGAPTLNDASERGDIVWQRHLTKMKDIKEGRLPSDPVLGRARQNNPLPEDIATPEAEAAFYLRRVLFTPRQEWWMKRMTGSRGYKWSTVLQAADQIGVVRERGVWSLPE